MELKILEWNINQRGRQYSCRKSKDGEIPLWIFEYIPEDVNVVVFTEFNCHAQNISEFYKQLAKKGFDYYSTNYTCAWANDVLIAVRGKDIKVKGLSWEIAYDRKRGIDRKSTPDNLRVDICINNKDIHIWGIRIKDLSGNYDKRKVEMKTLVEWVNNTTGINIIVGDFNNLREDTIIGTWNLKVLDELLGDKLERETPKENYSWGVAKSKDQFVGYIKNDHLIHSKEVEANVDEYIWDFLKKCDYELKAPAFGRQQLKIPVCQPDHGILIGTVTI